jgi:hypothetical protein
MNGGVAKLFALGSFTVLCLFGVDVWANPKGTQAVGTAITGVTTPAIAALSGQAIKS